LGEDQFVADGFGTIRRPRGGVKFLVGDVGADRRSERTAVSSMKIVLAPRLVNPGDEETRDADLSPLVVGLAGPGER
jgi:hypothetical protein